MGHNHLSAASDHLREAAIATTNEDHEQRLYDQSDQLARLAAADSGPDHGRLARVTHALNELLQELDADAKESVEAAKERVKAYRETVEGV
jgi:predicted amidophosphoribosyltransferase